MSLLSVVQDVCAVVGVTKPSTVFGSINSNRTMFEMLACANEMAQRIAYDTREWRQQKTSVTYPGNGVATAFNLPANYLRMLLTGNVWRSTSTQHPMKFVSDTDEWIQRRAMGYYDPFGEWTLLGDQMLIFPAMGVGVSATFAYLDKNCVVQQPSGALSDAFLNDTDTYRLPERLLKLGMITDWKMKKGSPYGEDMGTFQDALLMLMGSNKPAPIIIDNVPSSWNAQIAYPWQVPTP